MPERKRIWAENAEGIPEAPFTNGAKQDGIASPEQ